MGLILGVLGAPLQPDETFTIRAPYIENDIQALDCNFNEVSVRYDIPPTDEVLSLTGS